MNPADPTAVLARFPRDPAWQLHQLDWEGDRALLVSLAREVLRDASFLDDRVLPRAAQGFWAPLSTVGERAHAAADAVPHAIFHIGHCGSTLLSRQLDAWPGVLGLREPMVLRQLADWREDQRAPATARVDAATWQRWLRDVLALLARRHPGDTRVIVKATSSCNALVAPWLARDAACRAVLLWIPLDEYLATILKSPDARADCRRFARARTAVLGDLLGDAATPLAGADTATIVALGWLAEVARFGALAAAHPAQLREVEFGALLAGGAPALGDVAAHYGLDARDDTARQAAMSPAVQGRYAKAVEHAYDAKARAADLAESRRRFGGEIDAGLRVVEALVAKHGELAGVAARLRR